MRKFLTSFPFLIVLLIIGTIVVIALASGNAGNIFVTIGNKIMGKLGEKGEVLDSINISPNYFLN